MPQPGVTRSEHQLRPGWPGLRPPRAGIPRIRLTRPVCWLSRQSFRPPLWMGRPRVKVSRLWPRRLRWLRYQRSQRRPRPRPPKRRPPRLPRWLRHRLAWTRRRPQTRRRRTRRPQMCRPQMCRPQTRRPQMCRPRTRRPQMCRPQMRRLSKRRTGRRPWPPRSGQPPDLPGRPREPRPSSSAAAARGRPWWNGPSAGPASTGAEPAGGSTSG